MPLIIHSEPQGLLPSHNLSSSHTPLWFNASEAQPEPISDVKLVTAEGSTAVIDSDTMAITGLREFLDETELREKFLAVEGEGYYEIEYACSNMTGWPGTGSTVKLYSNSDSEEPVAVYTIVIYGDIDGDTLATSMDSACADGEHDFYRTMAADLNKDGVVNDDDGDIIRDASVGILRIDQTDGSLIHS